MDPPIHTECSLVGGAMMLIVVPWGGQDFDLLLEAVSEPWEHCASTREDNIRGKLTFYWSSERYSELSSPRKECK